MGTESRTCSDSRTYTAIECSALTCLRQFSAITIDSNATSEKGESAEDDNEMACKDGHMDWHYNISREKNSSLVATYLKLEELFFPVNVGGSSGVLSLWLN